MTTRNLVPRSNNEGQLGTSDKRWNKGIFDSVELYDKIKLYDSSELSGQIYIDNGNLYFETSGDIYNLTNFGDSAYLDVGTISGTVAAGDDYRFIKTVVDYTEIPLTSTDKELFIDSNSNLWKVIDGSIKAYGVHSLGVLPTPNEIYELNIIRLTDGTLYKLNGNLDNFVEIVTTNDNGDIEASLVLETTTLALDDGTLGIDDNRNLVLHDGVTEGGVKITSDLLTYVQQNYDYIPTIPVGSVIIWYDMNDRTPYINLKTESGYCVRRNYDSSLSSVVGTGLSGDIIEFDFENLKTSYLTSHRKFEAFLPTNSGGGNQTLNFETGEFLYTYHTINYFMTYYQDAEFNYKVINGVYFNAPEYVNEVYLYGVKDFDIDSMSNLQKCEISLFYENQHINLSTKTNLEYFYHEPQNNNQIVTLPATQNLNNLGMYTTDYYLNANFSIQQPFTFKYINLNESIVRNISTPVRLYFNSAVTYTEDTFDIGSETPWSASLITINIQVDNIDFTGLTGSLEKIRISANANTITGFNNITNLTGTSPHIYLQHNNLSADELNNIFTELPALAKTIDIRNNPGKDTCDTTIATNKGWTVQT